MKYKCVIFDCDGVLVDSEYIACQTLSEMLLPFGGIASAGYIMESFVGMKDTQVIQTIRDLQRLKLPESFMKDYEIELDNRLEKDLKAIPGIDMIIKNLLLPNALVSNSNYNRIITSLKSAGLYSCFSEKRIIGADIAGFAKPDPGIYLFALNILGITANEAIVIEDSPTGVMAATGAGIETVGFLAASHSPNQEEQLLANGANYIAHSSEELYNILLLKNIVK